MYGYTCTTTWFYFAEGDNFSNFLFAFLDEESLLKWDAFFNGKNPAPSVANSAALLFWFFGDFRCGVPLFIIILVIHVYKYKK